MKCYCPVSLAQYQLSSKQSTTQKTLTFHRQLHLYRLTLKQKKAAGTDINKSVTLRPLLAKPRRATTIRHPRHTHTHTQPKSSESRDCRIIKRTPSNPNNSDRRHPGHVFTPFLSPPSAYSDDRRSVIHQAGVTRRESA